MSNQKPASNSGLRPVIFGEVLFDHFPDGSVVLGGAPFNVAWHLHAFGLDPLFISRVGNDPLGRQIRDAMCHWGMDTRGLQLDSGHPTGIVEVSIHDNEPSFEITADRAYDFIDAGSLPPLPANAVIYHGSLALRNASSRAALERLKNRCHSPVFVDVNLRPPWWDKSTVLALLDDADQVKLNEDELAALAPGHDELSTRARTLQSTRNIKILIVTRGKAGAVAFSESGASIEVSPTTRLSIVDTVGAGDAFSALMLLGLVRHWPLGQIMERAQAFASTCVGVRGATISNPDFYQPFVTAWK